MKGFLNQSSLYLPFTGDGQHLDNMAKKIENSNSNMKSNLKFETI